MQAGNVIVCGGIVVPSTTVPGIGVPLETVPKTVDGETVVPGITLVPGIDPETQVGMDWEAVFGTVTEDC